MRLCNGMFFPTILVLVRMILILVGFEHVFLGEIDDGKVKGVHNWIWLYKMEKKGNIDYQVKLIVGWLVRLLISQLDCCNV